MADLVRHVSREELERREDALIQVLDVLQNWTEDAAERELAEVRFLLGAEAAEAETCTHEAVFSDRSIPCTHLRGHDGPHSFYGPQVDAAT